MVAPREIYNRVINSGSTVISSVFEILGARAIGIIAPGLTSCSLFLEASTQTASASFAQIWDKDGAAKWSWDLAAGSASIVVQDSLWPFKFAKVLSSVAQTDNRSFSIIVATR